MEWFRETVFQEEALCPRPKESRERVPALISAARSLENGMGTSWQSRESTFVKQARVLENYEDDYVYEEPVMRYYPTYQSLTDPELRGYFTWRTRLRRGDVRKTSQTYAFLYIYELLNQIGVTDPMDGYRKLQAFQTVYGKLEEAVLPYLSRWMFDYVIYYGLDPALLADAPQVRFDRSVAVLDDMQNHDARELLEAVTLLSSWYLSRSKFYGEYREDMDTVIPRVLRRVSEHYAKRCKKTMVEQYFGACGSFPVMLFETAVFYDRLKPQSRDFVADEVRTYRCRNGFWSVQKYDCPERPSAMLGKLIKTIDAVMRECYAYRHPIKRGLETKWLIKLIQEEANALLAEKQAAEAKKITIDYSRLAKIRRDAAATQDKLIVEEETMEEEPPEPEAPEAQPTEDAPEETPLSGQEYRLLRSLLYGGDLGWVKASGLMLSVLVDGINEKLFDQFSDSVLTLEDAPEVVEDYIQDLKEMIHP